MKRTNRIFRRYPARLLGVLVLFALLVPVAAPAATSHQALSFSTLSVQELNFNGISAGGANTCALTTDGSVKCWGETGFGQPGDPTYFWSSVPTSVAGLASGNRMVSAGGYHACVLTSGGGVKCWGDNDYGQLGDGTTDWGYYPVDVANLTSGIQAIVAGGMYTCALTDNGGVKCWGKNGSGRLGDGTTEDRYSPVDVSGLATGVRSIAAGLMHTCALTNAGGVKCWGDNEFGQLGNNSTNQSSVPVDVSGLSGGVTAIAVGDFHTCALTNSGGVKCWGDNEFGQLGDGTGAQSSLPVDTLDLSSGINAISAAWGHTCALTSSGSMKCWGDNEFGQLGDGTTTQRNSPVDVIGLDSAARTMDTGDFHTCAIADTQVMCWGDNGSGQLGDGTLVASSIPVDTNELDAGAIAATSGLEYACALTSAGGARCWGRNDVGQLGNGTTIQSSTPVDVTGLAGSSKAISAGLSHACALTSGGGVKCWGDNYAGQLGNGTSTGSSTPVDVVGLASGVSAISAGNAYTCALTSAGGMKCWGSNDIGQLGDGTTIQSSVPVDVFGLNSGVRAIAAGYTHTCAVTAAGSVKCWGLNGNGELGDGTTNDSLFPVDVVGINNGVDAISVGVWHSCILTSVGGVKCWGGNPSGQLGDGTTNDSLTPVDVLGLTSGAATVAVGGYHSCALTTNGSVICWGNNWTGQLGDGTHQFNPIPTVVTGFESGAKAIEMGDDNSCALTSNGRLKCWGADNRGQLGIGRNTFSTKPVPVVEAVLSVLRLNYTTGQPGSYLTLTGWNFPPGSQAQLSINNAIINSSLAINPTGSFLLFLDTAAAEKGIFTATVTSDPRPAISFILDQTLPNRGQEGGGNVIVIPSGVAFQYATFLPTIKHHDTIK